MPRKAQTATPEDGAPKEVMEEPAPRKKHAPDNLRAALKALPEGTKERQAFEEHGQGYTREEFREFWLEAIKAEPQKQKKAAPAE